MKFEKFLSRIDEKITKKEIQDALANENIIVGGEFEWIPNIIASKIGEVDSSLQDMYRIALRQWNEFENDYENYTEAIGDLEERTNDLQFKIENTIQDLESIEIDIEDSEEDKDDLLAKKEELESQIADFENELADVDIEKNRLEEPQIPNELEEYLEIVGDYRDSYDYEEFYSHGPPNNPEDSVDDEVDQDKWLKVAEKHLPKLLKEAPFSKWKIAGYDEVEQKIGSKTWAIEYDQSIADEGGVEFGSPPMSLPDFLKVMKKMFDFINKNGYTSRKCGFHIHMSLPSKNKIDLVKLILFTEEDYIFKLFKSRENNEFVTSMKNALKNGKIPRDEIKRFMGKKDLSSININREHYDAINLVDPIDNHVEFRYIGGRNYEKSFESIKNVIARYANTLSIALDPEFKRKEYIRKLMRGINSYEYSLFLAAISTADEFKNAINASIKTPEDRKKYMPIIKKADAFIKKMKGRTRNSFTRIKIPRSVAWNYFRETTGIKFNFLEYQHILAGKPFTAGMLDHFLNMVK